MPPQGAQPDIAPLTRTQGLDTVAAMALTVGSGVELVWRARQTLDSDAGDWVTTLVEVESIGEDDTGRRKFATRFNLSDEGVEHTYEGTLPVEYRFEVASMKRVRAPAPSMASLLAPTKRFRDEPVSTADPAQAVVQANAIMDAQRGKTTTEVENGDGFRVPSKIAALHAGLYPHYWFARKARGEDATTLALEWRKAIDAFRTFVGATFRHPQRRDAYLLAVENTATMIFRAVPSSKLEWRPLFTNVAILLKEIYTVTFSAKAGEAIQHKVEAQFAEGLLDIEDILRKADLTCSETPMAQPSQTQPQTQQHDPQVTALLQQNKALQSQLASLSSRLDQTQAAAKAETETFRSFRGMGGNPGPNWPGRSRAH